LTRWKAFFFRPAGGKVGIPIVPGGEVQITESAGWYGGNPQKYQVVKWKFSKGLDAHITRIGATTRH